MDVPKRGKFRNTTSKQDKTIIWLFECTSALHLYEAKALLAKRRIYISINTIACRKLLKKQRKTQG